MPNRGEKLGPDTVNDQRADASDELPAGDDEDTLVGDELVGSTEIAGEPEEVGVPTKVESADAVEGADRGGSPPEDDDNEFDVPTRVEGKRRSKPPSGENEFEPSTIVETDRE